ncbi:Pyridoxamine 5'-phosphate oxidase [Gracilaria domingensis]|nr:Pyridoxamine 5'-phosphate oxidase [Gracilaria domingensis]
MPHPDDSWLQSLTESLALAGGLGEDCPSQLATISGAQSGKFRGLPACRTVIIRKVGRSGLCFGTHEGSLKLDDISSEQYEDAELCWYFEASRVQFRILAKAEVDTSAEMMKEIWETYTELEKKRFLLSADIMGSTNDEECDRNMLSLVPDTFRVVKLVPYHVKMLHLGEKRKAEKARMFTWEQSETVEVIGRTFGP